jgi:hypothetical protein
MITKDLCINSGLDELQTLFSYMDKKKRGFLIN